MKKAIIMIATMAMAATVFAAQCSATTKKGSRCKRQAAAGASYCWQHGGKATAQRVPEAIRSTAERQKQCKAITKDGERCELDASAGSEYCWQHQRHVAATNLSTKASVTTSKKDGVVRGKTPVSIGGTCTAITKAGKRCKRKAAAGSDKCWQHAR